jgi:dihydroneopterin aldolase
VALPPNRAAFELQDVENEPNDARLHNKDRLKRKEMIDIFLEGIEFYAYHGVPDAEREIGHRYRVDLKMRVDSQAEISDSIEDTVDYGAIGSWIVTFGSNQKFRTLEHLANKMGLGVLDRSPKIASVTVTVRKLLPPAPFIAEASGVTLELHR